MLPQINLAACWLLLVSYALLYVCDTKMTLFFFQNGYSLLENFPCSLFFHKQFNFLHKFAISWTLAGNSWATPKSVVRSSLK